MNLMRWDPFPEFGTLLNRMAFPALWPRLLTDEEGARGMEFLPPADIVETEKEYLVRAELPGLKKEDVKVTLGDGYIAIEGERKQEKVAKDEKFHRVERYYGKFARTFALPENIVPDAIRCETKDGVLTVHVPKTEHEEPREIVVQ